MQYQPASHEEQAYAVSRNIKTLLRLLHYQRDFPSNSTNQLHIASIRQNGFRPDPAREKFVHFITTQSL
jgi:hypothetical protein